MLGHSLSVVVGGNLSMILFTDFRTCQTLRIIADGQHQLFSHQTLRYEVEGHSLGHFSYHHTGFLECVWFLQHLSATE